MLSINDHGPTNWQELSEEWPSDNEAGVGEGAQTTASKATAQPPTTAVEAKQHSSPLMKTWNEDNGGSIKVNENEGRLSQGQTAPLWKKAPLKDFFSGNPLDDLLPKSNASSANVSALAIKEEPAANIEFNHSKWSEKSKDEFGLSQAKKLDTTLNLARNMSMASSVFVQQQPHSYDPFMASRSVSRFHDDHSESMPDQKKEIQPVSVSVKTPLEDDLQWPDITQDDSPSKEPITVPTKENFSFSIDADNFEQLDAAANPTSDYVPLFKFNDLQEFMEDVDETDSVPFLHEAKRPKIDTEEDISIRLPPKNLPPTVPNTDFAQVSHDSLELSLDGALSSSPQKRQSSLSKGSDYPDHIDFLDDISDGDIIQQEQLPIPSSTIKSSSSNEESANGRNFSDGSSTKSTEDSKKTKMVTIRNLNSSSVLMSMMGDSHNMSFNDEKKCWEGPLDKELNEAPFELNEQVLEKENNNFTELEQAENKFSELEQAFDYLEMNSAFPESGKTTDLLAVELQTSLKEDYAQTEDNILRRSVGVQSEGRPSEYSSSPRKNVLENILKALKLDNELKLSDKIDLSGYEMTSVQGLNEQIPNLKHVKLDNNRLVFLQGLSKSVLFLSAENNLLSNLTSFQSLTNLKFLNISGNKISDLQSLSPLIHLRELHASYNDIEDLSPIKSMESLQVLSLRGNKIENIGLEHSDLWNLVSLDLSENQIYSFSGIESLQSLRELILDSNHIRKMNLKADMPQLETLSLNQNYLDVFDCRHLIKINTLFVDENYLGPFMHEYSVDTLTVLSAERQNGDYPLDINLEQFPALKELRVSGSNMTKMYPIKGGKQIQALVVKDTNITSLKVLGLKSFVRHLRALDLSRNPIDNINILAHCTLLRGLWLVDCHLINFSSCLKVLKKLNQLEVLDLRQNPMVDGLYADSGTFANEHKSSFLVTPGSSVAVYATQTSWIKRDEMHLKKLNDVDYVRRECYRSFLIHALDSLAVLDGIEVSRKEKKKSLVKMKKLKEIANRRQRFLLTDSPDRKLTEADLETPRHRKPKEPVITPFRDWKPVSVPLSSLSSHRVADFDVDSSQIRIEIPTPYKQRQ